MESRYSQLSSEERASIMLERQRGSSIRAIARMLGRSAATVSREIQRNGLTTFYCASIAGRKIRERRHKKPRRLERETILWQQVIALLKQGWSPQQIAGRLKKTHPESPSVSHETIYAMIYAQPRGGLRTELIAALRQGRSTRRPRSGGKDRRGQIPDLRPISERPVHVESRAIPGHWEGDLIKGKGNKSSIGSLVERTSRYTILVQCPSAESAVVTGSFTTVLRDVPPELRLSLTYDRGREMALHRDLTAALNLDVYFADPYSPWQRGTNENTNGLVRQFLPKGIDLSPYSQQDLNAIADLLNNRPRRALGYKTPKEVYFEALQAIPTSVALGH